MNPGVANRVSWFLIITILITGLLFPYLIGHDAPEYASIAQQMYYRNDWINIMNHDFNTGGVIDYLDKPHMLFWSGMLGYKLFGVHDWTYRLFTVIICFGGAFATFRIGAILYNSSVGRLAAIFFMTSQAIIISNHDVRTDSLLTSFVVLAIWQFVTFVKSQRIVNMIGGAVFLAAAVGTKGMIAVLVSGTVLMFYIAGSKQWRSFFNWKLLVGILVFFITLSPILYFYYLQFDLHPEKFVNGGQNMSGVKFLLWTQSFERFSGDRHHITNPEFIFFFHTLLWAFLPWSVILYTGVFDRIKELFKSRFTSFYRKEQLCFAGTWIMIIIMSFAKFKLPHYLNILFPLLSIFTAGYLYCLYEKKKNVILKRLYIAQSAIVSLIFIFLCLLCVWAFPLNNWIVILISISLLIYIFYVLFQAKPDKLLAVWYPSVLMILLLNFILNTHFYPTIGKYQAGSQIAKEIENRKIDWDNVYLYKNVVRSFDFYSKKWRPLISEQEISNKISQKKDVFLFVKNADLDSLRHHFKTEILFTTPDYHLTMIKFKFVNPVTREYSYKSAHLVRIFQ